MSGSSVGSVVGFLVGNSIAPGLGGQVGALAGSLIFGQLFPQHIKGPSIGDAQAQTSAAGVPRPVVFGHPAPFAGNHIDGDAIARKIIKKIRQGKGGGPVVEEEHFILTYAIRVSEPIGGYLRIWRQGKPVYDVRPLQSMPGWDDPETADAVADYFNEMQAANGKFLAKARLYLGGEDQLPDPALEAIHGVGNTPYYRGSALLVVEDDDVTDTGGAVPAYMFEVISCAVRVASGRVLVSSKEIAVGPPSYYVIDGGSNAVEYSSPSFAALWNPQYNASGSRIYASNSTTGNLGYVTLESNTWTGFDAPDCDFGLAVDPNENYLYSMDFNTGTFRKTSISTGAVVETLSPGSLASASALAASPNGRYIAVIGSATGWHVYNTATTTLNFYGYMYSGDACDISQNSMRVYFAGANLDTPPGVYEVQIGNLATGGFVGICGPLPAEGRAIKLHPSGGTLAVACRDPSGHALWIVDAAPGGAVLATITIGSGNHELAYNAEGSRLYVTNDLAETVDIIDVDPSSDTLWTVLETVSMPGGGDTQGGITAWPLPFAIDGWLSIPDAPGAYVDPITGTTYTPDAQQLLDFCADLTLQEVEETIAARAGVPAGKFDASALAGILIPGYLIAIQATGAECLLPLCTAFFHDLPEFDAKIQAVLRGAAPTLTVADDDLLEADDDAFIASQGLEFPLKVTVFTQHPEADYAAIPQTSERYSPDVKSSGEYVLRLPIPFDADRTAQIAAMLHNVLWTAAEWREEISLSDEYSRLIVSDVLFRNSRRWLVTRCDLSEGESDLEIVYDRASSYGSNATGALPPPQTPPGSGLIGPTLLEAMNLPILADAHDKLGFYAAVSGLLSGWHGALLQGSIDSGATWTDLATITDASVIGVIQTALPSAPSEIVDVVNVVRVAVTSELESITFEQLLAERNACVIGEEICQFQTATLISSSPLVYELSVLTRGRLNTTPADHAIGDRFVLLNAPEFIEAPSSWIGASILLRAVSLGTVEEANASETFEWSPALIQTEWAPIHFEGERDGSDNVAFSWIGRGRLGTTLSPINSVNFLGYRITITKGADSVVKPLTFEQSFAYSAAAQTADFGSATGELAITIEAMNRFTGASAPLTGTIL